MEKVFQSGTPDSETDRFSTLLGLLITFASFKIRYRRRGFRREKKNKNFTERYLNIRYILFKGCCDK